MERGPAAEGVTDHSAPGWAVIDVPGNLRGVADARGASPSDLWRPSVRRNDRRVR